MTRLFLCCIFRLAHLMRLMAQSFSVDCSPFWSWIHNNNSNNSNSSNSSNNNNKKWPVVHYLSSFESTKQWKREKVDENAVAKRQR